MGKTHQEMDKIARLLPYVSHKDEVVEIAEPIDPGKLLPGKHLSKRYSIHSSRGVSMKYFSSIVNMPFVRYQF